MLTFTLWEAVMMITFIKYFKVFVFPLKNYQGNKVSYLDIDTQWKEFIKESMERVWGHEQGAWGLPVL